MKFRFCNVLNLRILNLDIVSNFVLRASNLKNNRGTSLLELLIYIAVFSTVVVFLANIFPLILRSRTTTNARLEVQENIRFVTERIQQEIWGGGTVVSTGGVCPLNTLNIGGSTGKDFRVSSGVLQLDPDATGVATWKNLTSFKVTIDQPSDCMFTRLETPSGSGNYSIQVKMKVRYNDGGRSDLKYSESVQFTVAPR